MGGQGNEKKEYFFWEGGYLNKNELNFNFFMICRGINALFANEGFENFFCWNQEKKRIY